MGLVILEDALAGDSIVLLGNVNIYWGNETMEPGGL